MPNNYVRFDDPFEFGHNYHPEFSEAGSEQFGAKYFLENIKNIFTAPVLLDSDMTLQYPIFNGFMFLYSQSRVHHMVHIYRQGYHQKRAYAKKGHRGALLWRQTCFFCAYTKRSAGGQFGARYTVDLIPYVALYFVLRGMKDPGRAEVFIGISAIMFNLYGALALRP